MGEKVTKLKDAKTAIKSYEDIIKTNKKIIGLVAEQGQILKKIKKSDQFLETVHLSKSNIYFKNNVCKFATKYLLLKNSTLSSNYFENNFKMIKAVLQRESK